MENIIEGNKIIAAFMGIKGNDGIVDFYKNPFNGFESETERDLQYHSSWDWLMPVFLKIGTMWLWHIDKFGCKIHVPMENIEFGVTGKESNDENSIRHCAWLGVVEFIKWYNATNQNNQ